jgi:hypothetical protein
MHHASHNNRIAKALNINLAVVEIIIRRCRAQEAVVAMQRLKVSAVSKADRAVAVTVAKEIKP